MHATGLPPELLLVCFRARAPTKARLSESRSGKIGVVGDRVINTLVSSVLSSCTEA